MTGLAAALQGARARASLAIYGGGGSHAASTDDVGEREDLGADRPALVVQAREQASAREEEDEANRASQGEAIARDPPERAAQHHRRGAERAEEGNEIEENGAASQPAADGHQLSSSRLRVDSHAHRADFQRRLVYARWSHRDLDGVSSATEMPRL